MNDALTSKKEQFKELKVEPDPPENTDGYRFNSVAVKEPRFEIDGVSLPPEGEPGAVFFVESQFQKDERLYERFFAEGEA